MRLGIYDWDVFNKISCLEKCFKTVNGSTFSKWKQFVFPFWNYFVSKFKLIRLKKGYKKEKEVENKNKTFQNYWNEMLTGFFWIFSLWKIFQVSSFSPAWVRKEIFLKSWKFARDQITISHPAVVTSIESQFHYLTWRTMFLKGFFFNLCTFKLAN